jgi:hypothetical protein
MLENCQGLSTLDVMQKKVVIDDPIRQSKKQTYGAVSMVERGPNDLSVESLTTPRIKALLGTVSPELDVYTQYTHQELRNCRTSAIREPCASGLPEIQICLRKK